MNSIIDSVAASRRLKIFTAYYAMIYVVINLVLNLVKTGVPFFGTTAGELVFKLISLVIQAPFMYGLIRGIITKSYNVAEGLKAFAETKNYLTYLAYIAINFIYEAVSALVTLLGKSESDASTLGFALAIVVTLFRFVLNLFLVKMYFDSIDSDGKLSLGKTLKGCGELLTKRPLKFAGAELFMLVVGIAATVVSSMLAGILPAHWSVSLILSCLNSVQYGFIILTWPVYYLYYRASFEE